jgi:hypothetical protein
MATKRPTGAYPKASKKANTKRVYEAKVKSGQMKVLKGEVITPGSAVRLGAKLLSAAQKAAVKRAVAKNVKEKTAQRVGAKANPTRRKVSEKDAAWAVKNMGKAPGNSKPRGIAKTNRSGTGLSPRESIRVKSEQPVNKRYIDPKVLQERAKQRAIGRAIERDKATKTRRPARPVVKNNKPVKRDTNLSRTTFEKGKYRARGSEDVLDDLKFSPGKTTQNSRPTIESRTSQSPSSRGVNVNKGKSDKAADRMVSAAINKGRGFKKPGPKEVSKNDVLKSLRAQWKTAGPAQRQLIERQANRVKRVMK